MGSNALVIPLSDYIREGSDSRGWPETSNAARARDVTTTGEWLTLGQVTRQHRTPPDLVLPERFHAVLERCEHVGGSWDLLALSAERQLLGKLRFRDGRILPSVEVRGAMYLDRAFLNAVGEGDPSRGDEGCAALHTALGTDTGRIHAAALTVRAMHRLDEAASLAVAPAQGDSILCDTGSMDEGLTVAEILLAQRFQRALRCRDEAAEVLRGMPADLRFAYVDTLGGPRDETRVFWTDKTSLSKRESLVHFVEIYDGICGGYGPRVLKEGGESPRAFVTQTGSYATGIRMGGSVALVVSGPSPYFGRIASIVHPSDTPSRE